MDSTIDLDLDPEEEKKKFAFMFRSMHYLLKENNFESSINEANIDLAEIARGFNQSYAMDYKYKGIRMDTMITKKKEKGNNDRFNINHKIEFNLNNHIEKIHQQDRLKNHGEINELLFALVHTINMKIKPDGVMLDMNAPMPSNFHEQFGPNTGNPYGQLLPHHPQAQAVRNSNKMKMEHREDKVQHMRGQPSSSLTSEGGDLGSYDNLLSSRNNAGEVQLTASSTQIHYNELDMDDEELITTQHLNRTYRPGNGITDGPLSSSSSSSSYKDESLTTSRYT